MEAPDQKDKGDSAVAKSMVFLALSLVAVTLKT